MQPRVLLDGLALPESPRWHDGRLWFSNWGTSQIVAVDLDGNSEVVGEGPEGLGWATNWLPDGRLLITGPELIRVEPDGSRVRHADLSHISPHGWSELTVDGRGNVYVNTINFDFAEFDQVLASGRAPGKIALITLDGEALEVANELAFPNGMVITPDNKTLVVAESFAARLTSFDIGDDGTLSNRRTWADGVGPDGICLDASGHRARAWRTTAPASARAVTCSSGSTSAARASRPCSAAPAVRHYSCSPRTAAAPKQSRTSSRREPDRCSSSTHARPASAGRNRCDAEHPSRDRNRRSDERRVSQFDEIGAIIDVHPTPRADSQKSGTFSSRRCRGFSGELSIEVLQELVCCKFDLLVPPLRGTAVACDQPHPVQTADVAVDKRVLRFRSSAAPSVRPRRQAAYSSQECPLRNAFCSRGRGCPSRQRERSAYWRSSISSFACMTASSFTV
jgi:hypothetical protein